LSIHTEPSKLSYRLYLFSAILMVIEAGILFSVNDLLGVSLPLLEGMGVGITAFFAILFFIGAFFAKTGLGVTGTTREYVGGGWYRDRVESANAMTCGCMTGLVVVILSFVIIFTGMEELGVAVVLGASPALLSGVVAIFAGLLSIRSTHNPSKPKPRVYPSTTESKTCSYCGKTGISPNASACPNCGEPLK